MEEKKDKEGRMTFPKEGQRKKEMTLLIFFFKFSKKEGQSF